MTSVSNTQRDYIETQLKAFIERIGDTGTWDKTEALAELGDWIESATFKIPRKIRVSPIVADENRCLARSWAGGVGGQCKKAKLDGQVFCKNCAKKCAVCSTPASFNMDGTHKGLFWGRVDEALPIEAADGEGVAIMWKSETVKDSIRELLSSGGSWHPFCTASKEGFRTGDWDAARCSDAPSGKKTKKSTTKKKSKKTKRTKNAYLFYMADARGDITNNLRQFVEDTKMTPVVGVHYLSESANDLSAALAAFTKLAKKKKFLAKKLASLEIDGDGKVSEDFVFKGKYAMGPIGKLGGALWGKMTDLQKKPFKDMAAKAKAEVVVISDEEIDSTMSDEELELVAEEPASDDDELEIEDLIAADGTAIMVDDNNVIYNDDGEEIGTFDRGTKTASYFDDDE